MSAPAARLATFAALAGFASYHWFTLVSQPPLWRWAGVLAVTALLGMALEALRRVARPVARNGAAVAAVIIAALAGLLVTGVELRLLAPGGWPELRGNLASGLAGVGQVGLPYAGPDEWTRLGILLAAPLVLIVCGALAFWPVGRSPRRRRILALVGLVALYGFSVTWEAPSAELARGLALLAIMAAYLWLPRLPARRTIAAAGALALAGMVAVPVAARVQAEDPLIDYRAWAIFGAEREVSFDWNHSYGPFDWPQRGTTLLEIRSDRPLLWKTSVLDTFAGSRWLRSPVPEAPAVPTELAGASAAMVDSNRKRGWSEFPGIRVRSLRSGLLVGAGITRSVEGVETEPIEGDGTTVMRGEALTEGDSYSIEAYAPNPSSRRLRRADGRYPAPLARYTALALPFGTEASLAIQRTVITPLRDPHRANHGDPVGETVAGTAYERVYELALRLTRGRRTAYGAVSAIERHLRTNYAYNQDVPLRRNPLPAFLFLDREGYCQQFSGAMALMLRMVGIPSRVATGFSPGFVAPGDNVYTVRDTDAHSWVEVWFRGIGWVAFDPTPGAAPASSQSLAAFRAQGPAARFGAGGALSAEQAAEAGPRGGGAPQGGDEGGASVGGAAFGLLALGSIAAATLADIRRRRMLRPEGAAFQLRELEEALPRLGHVFPPGATLLDIERRLEPAGPAASRYVAKLRANRFVAGSPRRPGGEERRALRRALARSSALWAPRARWRALRAIPPGGPRR